MYQALLDITHLRYRLMPYIYSQSWKITSEGYTMMRGLPMDFPDDVKVRDISDAFMFGPAFLVHPVTRAMYNAETPPPATLPTEYLRTPDGKPGLAVQYFAGDKLRDAQGKSDRQGRGSRLARSAAGRILPAAWTDSINFSARWEGMICSAGRRRI